MPVMKKLCGLLACLLLALGSAHAAEQFDGTVIAGSAVSIKAPFGGTIKSLGLRTGAQLTLGEVIAHMETTRVLATEDGTIRGVFASVGDEASSTVMYLQPVSKFTISASVSSAEETASTKYVTLGEEVFIRCTKDGSHKARGVVTAVRGSAYTVQTTAGELYMEEKVNLYRDPSYSSNSCIGSGSVSRTNALAVSGTGSIIAMHVHDGDEVERGQLLFETVEGTMGETPVLDSVVRADAEGVIAEIKVAAGQRVAQDDVLLTVYRPQDYQIAISVAEDMLSSVSVGDEASIYFNWNMDNRSPFAGRVEEVSFMSESSDGSDPVYTAYLSFQADETVRLGMNVTVVIE